MDTLVYACAWKFIILLRRTSESNVFSNEDANTYMTHLCSCLNCSHKCRKLKFSYGVRHGFGTTMAAIIEKTLNICFFHQVLAVKKINPSLLHGGPSEEFSQIVSRISKLHHPNIVELVGYCSEPEHMLIYDYFRNGSLHDFLHLSDDFSKPLTWNTRVRIALGAARAVELVYIYYIVLAFWRRCYDSMNNIFLHIDRHL